MATSLTLAHKGPYRAVNILCVFLLVDGGERFQVFHVCISNSSTHSRSQSMAQEFLAVSETLEGPQLQNYVHKSTEILFASFVLILPGGVFQRL